MQATIELTPPRQSASDPAPAENGSSVTLGVALEHTGNNVRASWPFALDKIQTDIAYYSSDAKRALIAAFLWCIDSAHPISFQDFAKRVGNSDNTLWKIYRGRYFHPDDKTRRLQPSDALIAAINKFLIIERTRYEDGSNELVMTPTLKSIVTICELARESQTICTIKGASCLGKTWATEKYYVPRTSGALYTRMTSVGGQMGMLRGLARTVGTSAKGGNSNSMFEAMMNALNKDMVWVLDEMSLLAMRKGSFKSCINLAREIHDSSKIGMVWTFTNIADFENAKKRELMEAWRRGVHKLVLPDMPTIADLTAIFEHSKLEFPDKNLTVQIKYRDGAGKTQTLTEKPRDLVYQVARDEALLAITERLRYAKALAKRASAELTWTHFVEAHLRIVKQANPVEEVWS